MNTTPKQKIKAVIVEDELRSIVTLKNLLSEYCPDVDVIAEAGTVKNAVTTIHLYQPDLIFLDISMPDGDGFEVLEQISNKEAGVIFTTAYDAYAIKAFDSAALHYLLKPLNYLQLQQAVQRYRTKALPEENNQAVPEQLPSISGKMLLPTQNGYLFIELDEVIRLEADGNYTVFFMVDQNKQVASRSLSYFDNLLSQSLFFRIHDKHLINVMKIKKYIKGKGGQVVMSDGSNLDVSVRKKDAFLAAVRACMK